MGTCALQERTAVLEEQLEASLAECAALSTCLVEAVAALQQAPSSATPFSTARTTMDSEVTLVDDGGPSRWPLDAAAALLGGFHDIAAAPGSSAAPAWPSAERAQVGGRDEQLAPDQEQRTPPVGDHDPQRRLLAAEQVLPWTLVHVGFLHQSSCRLLHGNQCRNNILKLCMCMCMCMCPQISTLMVKGCKRMYCASF